MPGFMQKKGHRNLANKNIYANKIVLRVVNSLASHSCDLGSFPASTREMIRGHTIGQVMFFSLGPPASPLRNPS